MSEEDQIFTYKIENNSNEIKFSYEIGYGQKALTSLRLNSVEIECTADDLSKCFQGDFVDDINDVEIGKASDLNLSNLEIQTFVKDTQANTNMTSVTIKITGGVVDFYRTFTQEADGNQSVAYYFQIKFRK